MRFCGFGFGQVLFLDVFGDSSGREPAPKVLGKSQGPPEAGTRRRGTTTARPPPDLASTRHAFEKPEDDMIEGEMFKQLGVKEDKDADEEAEEALYKASFGDPDSLGAIRLQADHVLECAS